MNETGARPTGRQDIQGAGRAQAMFLPTIPLPEGLAAGPIGIADMANAFGVTHRTLHFYEEKQLIKAGRMGLMRVYSLQDVHRMAVITLAREVGMSIAVIQELMADIGNAASLEEADAIFNDALIIRKRELVASLSTVHRQMQQITHLLDKMNLDGDAGNDNMPANSLTDMEIQCLELMSEGLTPVRMARGLGLEPAEVQALEARVIGKFNANNRFQAVAKAVLLGIVK